MECRFAFAHAPCSSAVSIVGRLAVAACTVLAAGTADAATGPTDESFATQVVPFLQRYCQSCHGPAEKAKADLRVDLLSGRITAELATWQTIHEALVAGDMPPRKATTRPDAAETHAVLAWIEAQSSRPAPALDHAG